MSRLMKAANEAVFRTLDDYCQTRGAVLANAGSPRWISSGRQDKEFLRHAKVGQTVSFSPRRKLASVSLHSNEYILALGFDLQDEYAGLTDVPVEGGHLTFALSEFGVVPTATVSEIRQVVEYSDLTADSEYPGHQHDGIASLYPRVLLLANTEARLPWNIFFRLALNESRYTGSWVDERLTDILQMVAELDGSRIPYRVLCRSIFDIDPTSFYLAEYRCLEALFAYTSAKELSASLSLSMRWSEVATALEDTLGWYPHEDGSLTKLLALASGADLRDISQMIGKFTSTVDGPARTAARNIYWLRNSIVHYRPSQHELAFDKFNWNEICATMAAIVLHVYGAIN